MDLYGLLAQVVESTKDDSAVLGVHASGVVRYYAGEFTAAASELEQAAAASHDAAQWSDLAAARLEASIVAKAPDQLLGALVAANHALRLDSSLPAALYNRAAVIERIGLRKHAYRAWRLALVAETDPAWQEHIRERLAGRAPESDDEVWERLVERAESTTVSDVDVAHEIAGPFAQQARLAAETALPNDWGAAMMVGDVAAAQKKLKLARMLANAVKRRSQESLAADSIAVIDAAIASGDTSRVAKLAAAYVAYRDGRMLYRDHDHARAERKLGEAASAFATLGSPMEEVARYYVANAIADQGRVEEAASLNDAVARTARQAGPRRRALAAYAAWQTAKYEGEMGHWDTALRAVSEALKDFQVLGEKENSGAMESMLAELYDRLGQPRRAWSHRVAAFEQMSTSGEEYRLRVGLGAASRDRVRQNDWLAAIGLLDLEIELSQSTVDLPVLADALARRARAHMENGDRSAALNDIVAGRAAVAKLPDAGLRAHLGAILDAVEGVIERPRSPARSVKLLGDAIAFHARTGRKILLPELFLERGQSYAAAGDEGQALADFDSGIQSLEQQRATVSDLELSSTIGDAAEDLFAGALRIAVRRGDVQRAYGYSERSRGRALMQRVAGANDERTPIPVPAGVAVIEYAVLPEQTVVFTIGSDINMAVISVASAKLERSVRDLIGAIVNDSPHSDVREHAGELYELLLRPLGESALKNRTTVFVANKMLERVPWSALFDRQTGRYLIEDTNVLTASAATALNLDSFDTPAPDSALVVGNPLSSQTYVDLPPLTGAENEAKRIASFYPSAELLLKGEASKARFVRQAPLAKVVHFAGHAVSSDSSNDQSFIVLAGDRTEESGLLYSRDIDELPLNGVRLVVLAACGTMRGATVHLDGMPSIARSFIAAGAGAVIATLWDIDDRQSAELFPDIHRAIASGVSAVEAVRNAQVHAIHHRDQTISHPKAWAGITLISGLRR